MAWRCEAHVCCIGTYAYWDCFFVDGGGGEPKHITISSVFACITALATKRSYELALSEHGCAFVACISMDRSCSEVNYELALFEHGCAKWGSELWIVSFGT